MLKIDTVIHNDHILEIKKRLAQAGINNYTIQKMNTGKSKLYFCMPRSTLEIICKTSEKDAAVKAISGDDSHDGGIIYVNQLTPIIELNNS